MERRTLIATAGVVLSGGCLGLAEDRPPTYEGNGSSVGSQVDAPNEVDGDYCVKSSDSLPRDIIEHYSIGTGRQHTVIHNIGYDPGPKGLSEPYRQMQESNFEKALRLLGVQRQKIDVAINGYETAIAIAETCDVADGDIVVSEASYGIESCNTIDGALADFEAACEAYVDADAAYGDSVPEAERLDEQAVTTLQDVEDKMPMSHNRLSSKLDQASKDLSSV